jgi:hypothetical protein
MSSGSLSRVFCWVSEGADRGSEYEVGEEEDKITSDVDLINVRPPFPFRIEIPADLYLDRDAGRQSRCRKLIFTRQIIETPRIS